MKNFNDKNVGINLDEIKQGSDFMLLSRKEDKKSIITSALEKGAECIICREEDEKDLKKFLMSKKIKHFFVKDPAKWLQEQAKQKRKIMKAKVIAITGSIGKTTTREMTYHVLSGFYKTHTCIKNYNNHIGLPLTIINAPANTEMLVLEMGMNHTGEIDLLTKIAKPDVAIITNIEETHIGNFQNINEIVRAKSEIFNGMQEKSLVILNKNSHYKELEQTAKAKKIKNIIGIGDKNSDAYIVDFEYTDNFTTKYKVCCGDEVVNCEIKGYNEGNMRNSLFIFALCKHFGLNLELVAERLKTFSVPMGRGNVENITTKNGKNIKIINDCYNSSPEALRASLKSFGIYKQKNENSKNNERFIAIIGDMLELGKFSHDFHKNVVDDIINNGIEDVILVGEECKIIFDSLPENITKYHFQNIQDFVDVIDDFIEDGDALLLKGSRGIHLEEVIYKLKPNAEKMF